MKPSTVSSPKSAESTADMIGGTLCSRWCLAFSKTMVTVISMVTMPMVDCRSRKVVSCSLCQPCVLPPYDRCSSLGFSASQSDKSRAPPTIVTMRSIIPRCRFNARGTPIFGLIFTGCAPVLTATFGEPGTVRTGLETSKPLAAFDATATGESIVAAVLVEGDFARRGGAETPLAMDAVLAGKRFFGPGFRDIQRVTSLLAFPPLVASFLWCTGGYIHPLHTALKLVHHRARRLTASPQRNYCRDWPCCARPAPLPCPPCAVRGPLSSPPCGTA